MPYIKQQDREDLLVNHRKPHNVGELNFLVSSICERYLKNKEMSYNTINDIIGVLECAKLEFYRRIASPYEDIKIEENGDIY